MHTCPQSRVSSTPAGSCSRFDPRAPARATDAARALLARPRARAQDRSRRLRRVRVAQLRLALGSRAGVPVARAGARQRSRAQRADRGSRRARRPDAHRPHRRGADGRLGRHVRRQHPIRLDARRRTGDRRARYDRHACAVPRRDRDATAGARRPFDGAAAPLGRQHRLQAARRRLDAVPADPGRRRAALRRRRARRAGGRRGLRHRDRVPGRARAADA